MKKIYYLMIAVLISVSSFAQAPSAHSLRVINETNCYQFFYIVGGEICQCNTLYGSNLIGIASGAVLYYPDSTTIGGSFPTTTPKGINVARATNQPPPFNCPSDGGAVGQLPCGLPTSISFLTYQLNCAPCANTTMTWFHASNCDQEARLLFS